MTPDIDALTVFGRTYYACYYIKPCSKAVSSKPYVGNINAIFSVHQGQYMDDICIYR